METGEGKKAAGEMLRSGFVQSVILCLLRRAFGR